jgi:serine/threonine protein kinase
VDLLVYGIIRVEGRDDTTVFGQSCSSGEPMVVIDAFKKNDKANFAQHSGTPVSGQKGPQDMLLDPRRPKYDSQQECDNREHRDIITAWVCSSFDEAISLSNSLETISSIWQQAFLAIKEITENDIIYGDISFQNVRVDDQNKVKICDFDMAMYLNNQGTSANDRTGTIPFMATSLLSSEQLLHQPVHDCESVFWLCAHELLSRIAVGKVKKTLARIMAPAQDIELVADLKISLIARLRDFESQTEVPQNCVSLDQQKDSQSFFVSLHS